jgi:two-component system sensor histidine kinase BaeS
MRRRGLAFSVGLVTTMVAAVSVVLAAAVSVALVRTAVVRVAQERLARDADIVAGLATGGPLATRARQLRQAAGVSVDRVSPAGRVRGDFPLSAADISSLLAGRAVSGEREAAGRAVVIEGRPLEGGGAIVLAQGTGLTASTSSELRRAEVAALLVGLAGGALAGVLLARRLARPLRHAAAGAARLAAGHRAVGIAPEGPAEVAAVTEALNALDDALRTSEARQRDFLLSVSHELRTPLTAVRGFSEALADGVVPADEVRATGLTMLGESQRLERLVSDLLDLARLGAQDFTVDLRETDLTALVAGAADVWRQRCAAEGVTFSVEVAAGPPLVVVTDAGRVRQVVDGLAENALRVTPAGRPIVLALRGAGSGATVEVRDGGPGLTDDDLAVAFDRAVLYERYRGVRRVGTGLGLALVAALAARLGATVSAGHAPEGGACFSMLLPDSPGGQAEPGRG